MVERLIEMNTDIFLDPIFIAVAAVLLIVLIWFLVYYFRSRNRVNKLTKEFDHEKQTLIEDYEATQEEDRLLHKKEVSALNEKYYKATEQLNKRLRSVSQFTSDKGEYLTDLALKDLKNQLVKEDKIRDLDMHILSNIYLPSRNYTNTRKVDHLVLTRTGIYLMESRFWKGHIIHGVSEQNFEQLPYVENFFELLGLNKKQEQTFIFEKKDDLNVTVSHFNHMIEEAKLTAEKLKNVLKLQFDVVPVVFFNPEDNGNYSIANYSNDPSVKVLIGNEELDEYFKKYVFHGRFQYTVKDLTDIVDQLKALNP